MNIDHLKINQIQTSSISSISTVIDELSIDILQTNIGTAQTVTITTDFGTNEMNTENITTNTLTTTTYTIGELFSNQISASQQIITNTYTVARPTATNTNATTKKALIILGIIAAVVAVVAVTILSGGTFVIAQATGFAYTASLLMSSATVLLTYFPVAAGIAVGAAVSSVLAVSTLVTAAVLKDPISPPDLRAVAMDATFGKAFLSDMLFGTTSNTNVATPYVEFLLIQNEVNGSYALPRLIGYNPQLGFFDDGAYYGGQKAYLSLCTYAPYNTLRFEENGNLAIYDSTSDPPTWQSNTQVSSLQYKSNVRLIPNSAKILQQIDCIYYNDNDVGVKAQQLEQLFRQATFGEGRRVRLEKLVPLLIEGMKELYYMQESILNKVE